MTRPHLHLVRPHRYCRVCRLELPARTNPDHHLCRTCWRWCVAGSALKHAALALGVRP